MLNKNFALAHSPSAFSLWCAREPFFSLIRCFDRKVCNLLWIWCSSALNICFPLVEYVHSTRATNGNFSDSIKTMNNTIISISLVVCYMVPHRKNTRDQLTWRMQMSYSVSQSNSTYIFHSSKQNLHTKREMRNWMKTKRAMQKHWEKKRSNKLFNSHCV